MFNCAGQLCSSYVSTYEGHYQLYSSYVFLVHDVSKGSEAFIMCVFGSLDRVHSLCKNFSILGPFILYFL